MAAEIKLVASDLDHTLLTPTGELTAGTAALIDRLAALNIIFVPVSGRDLPTLSAMFPQAKWLIAHNGAITATAALNAPAGQPMVSGGASGSNLLNNTVTATAYGNNAVNQINIVALPGQLAASTNLTSTQINTGAVTATAGGNISSGGVSTGNNISGNRISAVAVGNNSVSSMTLGVK